MRKPFAIVALVALFSAGTTQAIMEEGSARKDTEVERGRYLVTIGGCNDCHTPKIMTEQGPRPDMARELSGFPEGKQLPEVPKDVIGPARWGGLASDDLTAWVGPWGISFAANLTPDETGMGTWSEDMFKKAMRTGRHKGEGRPILPPMPWYGLAPMTDEDLSAVFAYLQSIPAVKNKVPEPIHPGEVHDHLPKP